MQKLNILALTKSTGGIALYNRLLLTELGRVGMGSETLCLSHGAAEYALSLTSKGLGATPMDMARYSIDPRGDLRVLRHAIARIRADEIDVMICHGSKAGFIGRAAGLMTGCPVVYRQASMPFLPRVQGRKAPFYWALDFAARGFGGHVVTLSDYARSQTLRHRLVPPDRISIIRTGVDIDRFRPSRDRAARVRDLGLDPARPVVGWMGRIEPQKAPFDYVETLRLVAGRHPEAQFVLAGEGRLRGEVENALAAAGLSDRVAMLGWQPEPALVLRAFDVYVLTSHWEGLPLTLLEAMASGCCCISTDVDGCAEAIEDGVSGRLLAAGATGAMAATLDEVLRQPDLRHRYSVAARHRAVTLFDKSEMIDKWIQLLSRMTAETAIAARTSGPAVSVDRTAEGG